MVALGRLSAVRGDRAQTSADETDAKVAKRAITRRGRGGHLKSA